jgi:glycosyltransferase involved in cell wall biosynthesis
VAKGDEGVHFVGWRRDLESLLPDLDVALLTSRNEGTPVALIEAAAAGVPAVATDVGGVASVVQAGVTGLLVPSGDARSVADALLELLRDPERRERMGAAAREHVRSRFGAQRLADDVARLYDELSSR